MTYNHKRYIELSQISKSFQNQGTALWLESEDEYLELLHYKAAVESYIFWKSRTQFLLFMEKFVNKTISGEEFRSNFLKLRQELIDETDAFLEELSSEKFTDFQPDPRSNDFASFISFLRAECDNFIDDYQSKEFYDSIKNWFLKLQKFLNEE